jgi:uncharacterized RDD family membrane protein YckC
VTTTPPFPDEPEDTRDDAQKALDDLSAKSGQNEAGQYASSAGPQPLPPMPQPGQTNSRESGPESGRQYGRPAGQDFGQTTNQQYGQQYGGPAAAASQFGHPSGQSAGQQYGQSSGQQSSQPTGQPPYGQPTGQSQGNPGGDSPYGQYPSAPPPPGPYGSSYGYNQQPSGPPGMPAYAGWWQRVGASLLDNYLIVFALELIVSWSNSGALRTIGGLIALAWALYNAFLAGKTGQSYGKRAVGIRLARMEDGRPLGGGYGLLRWLMNTVFWLLCFIPGALNCLWPLWDSKHQTWSDKIANSVVVRAE